MIFVVSGEGSSDIGVCSNGNDACSGEDFRHGPMTVILEKLIKQLADYSLLDAGAFEFRSENHLKTVDVPSSVLRGKKYPKHETATDTKYFYHNARMLARLALELSKTSRCPVGAVLFRDADGTHSTRSQLYEDKWKSIVTGFRAEGFNFGVPMVPQPKSEAWLLCALRPNGYQNCAQLESGLSGNDKSPKSAKKRLKKELDRLGKSTGDLADMVNDDTINAARIDMPSFNLFRNRLKEVTQALIGHAWPEEQ